MSSVVEAVKLSLDDLVANVPNARVGIVTYHQRVHYYSLKGKEPQLFVVADIDNMFVPARTSDLLVPLAEEKSRLAINTLLDMIPRLHNEAEAKTAPRGCAFGAAITGAVDALTKTGGKILIFQASLPNCGAGTLTNRDEVGLYNTDQEKKLYQPQNQFYQT